MARVLIKKYDPDVSAVSSNLCADILGISNLTFKKRVRDGVYPTGSNRKRWNLRLVIPAHVNYVTSVSSVKDLNDSKRGIYEERLKALKAENALTLGELIKKADAEDVFSECMAIIASRLDALPGRLAAELAGINDAAIIRQRLRNEVTVLRGEASNRLKSFFDHPSRGGDHRSPTYQRPRRVGRPKSNSSTRVR